MDYNWKLLIFCASISAVFRRSSVEFSILRKRSAISEIAVLVWIVPSAFCFAISDRVSIMAIISFRAFSSSVVFFSMLRMRSTEASSSVITPLQTSEAFQSVRQITFILCYNVLSDFLTLNSYLILMKSQS